VKYDGPRHFDAHAYRTEDYEGVKDFARGCMRTYLILKERGERWNADKEIQALVKETTTGTAPSFAKYSASGRETLLAANLDRGALSARGLGYEKLDQLTTEVLLGVR
jgi:xylose isomerase